MNIAFCSVLFQHLGKVVTYRVLTSEVWGLMEQIPALRKGICQTFGKKSRKIPFVQNIWITEIGVGYRLRGITEILVSDKQIEYRKTTIAKCFLK